MKMTGLDILMCAFIILAIVIVLPMPWLLSPSRGSDVDENNLDCGLVFNVNQSELPESPPSLTVLFLITAGSPRPRSRDTRCTWLPPSMCHRPVNDAIKAQAAHCGQTIVTMRLPNLYLTHPGSQWRYPQ
ncbi:hypothetical protein [Budvicia aquatica]|uniref:hypothetical protein n=1 Tax=Budvicia aquatica TaxID=82979 RepID=UPI0020847FEE|nr:hypothetical protein [Budvicia aquatica]GKX52781.1 hypothetical protein SOASR029_30900 [Budvicia aquatica]